MITFVALGIILIYTKIKYDFMNELTVIIPFLNEKEEVENTIKSLLDHTPDIEVDIILINDASDDGYDYDSLENKYHIVYIKNSLRMGVAKCRDMGVDRANTPYFLLLDAHMRFYSNSWYSNIMSELKRDKRALLCCQSLVLTNVCNQLREVSSGEAYGARVLLDIDRYQEYFLEVKWITVNEEAQKDGNKDIMFIPCVLGAGYACNKEYWKYLNGLEGLMKYGCDEQFISLKVWLEGGSCKLLRTVLLGHIYRDYAPYELVNSQFIYNKLLIASLLLPPEMQYQYCDVLKKLNPSLFAEIYAMLLDNKEQIEEQRKYYSSIFTRSFDFVIKLNRVTYENEEFEERNIKFNNLEQSLIFCLSHSSLYLSFSILRGKCGLVIMLLLWLKHTGNRFFEHMAEAYLNQIYEELSTYLDMNFRDGLMGIGWGIEYLLQNGLIYGDSNEILEEIDAKVMSIRWERVKDHSLATGLRGVIAYVTARIKGCILSNNKVVFDQDLFNSLQIAAKNLLLNDTSPEENISYVIEFLDLIHNQNLWTMVRPIDIKMIESLSTKGTEIEQKTYEIIKEMSYYIK